MEGTVDVPGENRGERAVERGIGGAGPMAWCINKIGQLFGNWHRAEIAYANDAGERRAKRAELLRQKELEIERMCMADVENHRKERMMRNEQFLRDMRGPYTVSAYPIRSARGQLALRHQDMQ